MDYEAVLSQVLTQLHQAMEAVSATGQTLSRPNHLVLLTEVAGRIGQVGEGLHLLSEARTAANTRVRSGLSSLDRMVSSSRVPT
jgi:hypothetical protein